MCFKQMIGPMDEECAHKQKEDNLHHMISVACHIIRIIVAILRKQVIFQIELLERSGVLW
jgi:hypothetical protein